MPRPLSRLAARTGLALALTGSVLMGPALAAVTPADTDSPAAAIAAAAPPVRTAMADLRAAIARLRDPAVRAATADALLNPVTCVVHRAHLGAADKQAVVTRLVALGLADPADASAFPGGLVQALFPPLPGDGGPCPHLPQPVMAAPGSIQGGHHAWPGGLVVHESFNLRSAEDFAAAYRTREGVRLPGDRADGTMVDNDTVIAPPLWHDWAKALLFVWRPDGGLPPELALGGHGPEGDTRTGAHHILGLAEAMSRHLPPDLVIVQACAHHEPGRPHPARLVNWLRTAAVIARIDPVAAGYLVASTGTATGGLTVPGMPDARDAQPDGATVPRWWPACLIHAQSDHNWVYSEPAAHDADTLLRTLAPRYGANPTDPAAYAWGYRHPILAHVGAEALQAAAARGGLAAVAALLDRLRSEGVF